MAAGVRWIRPVIGFIIFGSVKNLSRNLVIRAEGNSQIGVGHFKRQADLAIAMVARGWSVVLLTSHKSASTVQFLRKVGGNSIDIKIIHPEKIPENLAAQEPDVVLLDLLEEDLDPAHIIAYRQNVKKGTVVIDDDSLPRPCIGNALVNANPCNLKEKKAYYSRLGVKAFLGPEYFLADPTMTEAASRHHPDRTKPVENILILFGGKDICNVVSMVLKTVGDFCEQQGITITVLQSPVSPFRKQNENDFRFRSFIQFHNFLPSIIPLFQQADLLIGSHGNVAYESAIFGVPMISLNLVERQNEQADAMKKIGAVINSGIISEFNEKKFLKDLETLIRHPTEREGMAKIRRSLVPGYGIYHIVRAIEDIYSTS